MTLRIGGAGSVAVLGLVLRLLPTAPSAQATADFSAQIDRIARGELARQHIPAMTVAVAANDTIVYSKAFGTADLENGVPATTETLIRTGSLAKPVTAVAAMTLVEAGRLDLNAPVQTYCPAFPRKPWPITTRELLTHTSSLRQNASTPAS